MITPIVSSQSVCRGSFGPCWLFSLVVLLGGLSGCDTPESLLQTVVDDAPAAGETATRQELQSLFDRELVKFGLMLRAAHAGLDEGPEGATFAAAVLELSEDIENEFSTGGEYELFWRQLGQLAYWTAYARVEADDPPGAWSVVLSGPKRWQNEAYWRAYPNHDALASMLMALFGDAKTALARLNSRAVETPELEQAKKDIRAILVAKSGR